DFFLYYTLRYGFAREKIQYIAERVFMDDYTPDEIEHWLTLFFRRFFSQQYKRSCLPDGPKVVGVSLSPRGDLRMPSDANEL
ncbi:MAG: NAD(+) synthase, partial [Paludibacteraceae bacterium]|nr:NAD(+) synthase [Paludibacteraceae bacterium]